MVAWQLLVALGVLHTTDEAQSQGNRQCASKRMMFCHHVRRAYLSNEDAKKILKLKHYDADWMALHEIDYLLLNILKKTDKAELLSYTDLALTKEAIELIQLNASCTARGWKYECYVTTYRLVEATVQLVEAIKDIAENDARTIATRALENYKVAERNRSVSIEKLVGHGITLGSSVTSEIHRKGLITFKPRRKH